MLLINSKMIANISLLVQKEMQDLDISSSKLHDASTILYVLLSNETQRKSLTESVSQFLNTTSRIQKEFTVIKK